MRRLTFSSSIGVAQAVAVALINLGIAEWQKGNQLVGAIFLVAGGLIFILQAYLQTAHVEKLAVQREEP